MFSVFNVFTLWNINPTLAFTLSALLPVWVVVEGAINGTLVAQPVFVVLVAAVAFVIVNVVIKVVDDLL